MRFIASEELRAIIPMEDAVVAVREAFVLSAARKVRQPGRLMLQESGALLMVAQGPELSSSVVAKIVTVRAQNRANGLPTLHAVVVLFDGATGQPVLVIEGGALTALRTGAASGVATDLLAAHDASVVAMIGAGQQAFDQIRGVCAVRRIKEVRICSRTGLSAELLSERVARELGEVNVVKACSPTEAVRDADIICCATDSRSPVIPEQEVGKRVHINAVGSYQRGMREVPVEILSRSSVIAVDEVDAALSEAGELIEAVEEGAIEASSLVELGRLSLHPPDVIHGVTVFKSVGIAMQDWALAQLARERVSSSATLVAAELS